MLAQNSGAVEVMAKVVSMDAASSLRNAVEKVLPLLKEYPEDHVLFQGSIGGADLWVAVDRPVELELAEPSEEAMCHPRVRITVSASLGNLPPPR